jgi:hypothetical protein
MLHELTLADWISWCQLLPTSNKATRRYYAGVLLNSVRWGAMLISKLALLCDKLLADSPSVQNYSRAYLLILVGGFLSSVSSMIRTYSEALAFLTKTRQTALLSAFLDALTRGGPSGLPRPIELHAHDPIRYLGDMLAWVHQAIAAECEFLESLFGLGGQEDEGRARRMVGAVRTFEGSEEEGWVKELLNSAVTKLCVPLKVGLPSVIQ